MDKLLRNLIGPLTPAVDQSGDHCRGSRDTEGSDGTEDVVAVHREGAGHCVE
jgi:hypothetical protein